MDEKTKLADAVQAVVAMHRSGTLEDDAFHKTMVTLAYQYSLLETGLSEAQALLNVIPIEYYYNTQEQQMLDDPAFARLCMELGDKLVAAGVVRRKPTPLEPILHPTQKQAQA